tara:strand:- start:5477 stop:6262 length:786 start_codon:yes stop_codon:yes gene_type:complete
MANAHGDFIWYELLTTDAEAARTFYADVIGWTATDSGQPAIDYRILAAAEGNVGGLMQITDDMRSAGARPVWLGYIAVDDVDQTVAAITAAGGAIQMSPMDIPDVGRIAMATDPQGAPFYVMRGASDEQSHAFAYDRPRLGHCAWNELATSDRAGAMQFYSELFGWEKDGEMDMGPLGAYEFVRRGAVAGLFAGVMTRPREMPVSLWSFYFRVADVDAAIRRTQAGGGEVIVGPMEIPGGEFSVNARDPQGAMFAFMGPRT